MLQFLSASLVVQTGVGAGIDRVSDGLTSATTCSELCVSAKTSFQNVAKHSPYNLFFKITQSAIFDNIVI